MKRDVYLSDRPLEEAVLGYLEALRDQGLLKPGRPERIPADLEGVEAGDRVRVRII